MWLFLLSVLGATFSGEAASYYGHGPGHYGHYGHYGGPPAYGPPRIEPTRRVFALRQSNAACPSARSCPGRVGILEGCAQYEKLDYFVCEYTWSSGGVGMLMVSDAFMREMIQTQLKSYCGKCGDTIGISVILDAVVGLADPVDA